MAQNRAQPKHRLPLTFPFLITLGRAGKALNSDPGYCRGDTSPTGCWHHIFNPSAPADRGQ